MRRNGAVSAAVSPGIDAANIGFVLLPRTASASPCRRRALNAVEVQTYPVCEWLKKRYFMAASSKPRGP
jgi:hypothetical protein